MEGAFEWNVGSLALSRLRPVFGADLFHSDVRRGVSNVPISGSITNAGVLGGVRFDVTPDGTVSPYLMTGVTANYQWASASDPATEHDLKGGRFGVALGGGAAAWIGTSPFGITGDVRHIFSGNMSRTTYTLGVRVQPRLSQMRRQLDEKTTRVRNALDELIRAQEMLPDAEH